MDLKTRNDEKIHKSHKPYIMGSPGPSRSNFSSYDNINRNAKKWIKLIPLSNDIYFNI